MARTWPTVTEFQNMLYGAGIISAVPPVGAQASTYVDYQGAIQSAVDDFERETTLKPFLADGSEAQNQRIEITTTGAAPTGGTFKVSYAGQVTATIANNASSAVVQAALVALSTIGAGNATVTGAAGGPWTIVISSSLWPYSWLLLNTNSLTGPDTYDVIIDEPEQFERSPQGMLQQLTDTWFTLRKVTTNRSLGNTGATRTVGIDFEYDRRRGWPGIECLRWYGFQGGWGWQTAQGGYVHEVGLLGRRGLTDDLPPSVTKAILAGAGIQPDVLPLFSAKKSGGASKWREGDVSEETSTTGAFQGAYSAQFQSWQTTFDKEVARFKRLRVYGE